MAQKDTSESKQGASKKRGKRGEDERPPIIVRGGSLIIQSGDEKSGNPKHNKGKEWTDGETQFKQKHDTGKPVTSYVVSIEGPNGTCAGIFATDVTVFYQLSKTDDTEVATVTVSLTDKPGNKEPLVTSTRKMARGGKPENPTLTLTGESDDRIVYITAGPITYLNPSSAKLQPV